MQLIYIWLIIACSFFILELVTPGFLLACFGIGALLSTLIAFTPLGLVWQVFFFIIGSLLALFFLRPIIIKSSKKKKSLATGIDALIGKKARVVRAIQGQTTQGRIAIDGDEWPAFASNKNTFIEVDQQVIIDRHESIVMFVTPTKNNLE